MFAEFLHMKPRTKDDPIAGLGGIDNSLSVLAWPDFVNTGGKEQQSSNNHEKNSSPGFAY